MPVTTSCTGDAEFVDGEAGSDTFNYDASSNFGSDNIWDAGVGDVVDTIAFTGAGLTSIADLDARSSVVEVGGDVLAVVYTDGSYTTVVGNVSLMGGATGSIASWADIDALDFVEVVIV